MVFPLVSEVHSHQPLAPSWLITFPDDFAQIFMQFLLQKYCVIDYAGKCKSSDLNIGHHFTCSTLWNLAHLIFCIYHP